MCMLYTYRKCRTLLVLGVASRRSFTGNFASHSPFQVCLPGCIWVSFQLLVGAQMVFKIADGVWKSRCLSPSWLAGHLVNAVGVLQLLFLPMCLSASCLIYDNPGRNVVHELYPCFRYPAFMLLVSVSGMKCTFSTADTIACPRLLDAPYTGFLQIMLVAVLWTRGNALLHCWCVHTHNQHVASLPDNKKTRELRGFSLLCRKTYQSKSLLSHWTQLDTHHKYSHLEVLSGQCTVLQRSRVGMLPHSHHGRTRNAHHHMLTDTSTWPSWHCYPAWTWSGWNRTYHCVSNHKRRLLVSVHCWLHLLTWPPSWVQQQGRWAAISSGNGHCRLWTQTQLELDQ